MSGLDKIIARLQEDCENECRKIETDALKEVEAIIAEGEKRAEAECAAIRHETDEKADAILDKAKSAAALGHRQQLLRAKVGMIEDVIAKAQKKLHNLDEPSYFGMLKVIAEKNRQEGNGIMFLSERDLSRMPADFESSLSGITVSKVPCDIEDGFVLKYGDIEMNCTLAALVNSRRDELKSMASELLFA